MANEIIKTFENTEFGKVRVIMIENVPWFVGKDVASVLGYERGTKAIVDHVREKDRQMLEGKTQSQFGIDLGQRGGWIVNESGLYKLIFSSKLPKAEEFTDWVTSEVLPSIRETGSYGTAPYIVIPKFFKGHQVLTIKDAAAILNVSRHLIEEIINKPSANLHEGTDYYRLKGEKRAEFKRENPSIASCVHHIIAILESGFKKICNYFGLKEIPQVFIAKVKETKLAFEEKSEENLLECKINKEYMIHEQGTPEAFKVQEFLVEEYKDIASKMSDPAFAKTFGLFLKPLKDVVNYLGFKMFIKETKISPIVSSN